MVTNTRHHPDAERVVDMVGRLYRAPRTVKELAELCDMSDASVRIWLELLMQEGLVCKGENRPAIWTWDRQA